jgi:uncharacterized protein YbaR (Trm112 family)
MKGDNLLDLELLSLLVCPVSKTRLIYDEKNQELISTVAKLAYPIRNGIPIMLVDEARNLEDSYNNSGFLQNQ